MVGLVFASRARCRRAPEEPRARAWQVRHRRPLTLLLERLDEQGGRRKSGAGGWLILREQTSVKSSRKEKETRDVWVARCPLF